MGIKRRLLTQNVTIIILTISSFVGILYSGIYHYYYNGTTEMLKNHASNSAQYASRYMNLDTFSLRNQLSEIQSNFTLPQAETQIFNVHGKLLSSSTGFIPEEEHLVYKDVEEAFRHGVGTWRGEHPVTGEHILGVSVTLENQERMVGVLRFVTSLELLDQNLRVIIGTLIAIGIGILFIVFFVSTFFARNITTPIIELTKASQRLAKGELGTQVHGDYRDEFQTLSKSFNDMAMELLKTEKMKNEFISSVSHELRTPLTSIKGWSETLLTGDLQDTKETTTGLSIITSETDRLIRLVEELLDFSRYSKGSFTIFPSSFSIDQLIQEVILQLDKKREEKQISIVVQNQEEVHIYADKSRIRQVLINLIENAIKYSNPETTITIDYEQNERYFTCQIHDQGQGIAEEHLEHVSKLFFKERENSEGVGLGLAISKHIIQLHHGQLQLTSKKDEGTTAEFKLPLPTNEAQQNNEDTRA